MATSQQNGSETHDNEDKPLESYAGVTGEWETRQISIMGVVKRFISQLSYGQDLTKIAMPSEFLNPYSVLEFVSLRYLMRFSMLLDANKQAEPQYRMLHVIRWFLASLLEAKMYKKPYNPVVCETHSCFTENSGTRTHAVGEQVTHHPPVSAFHVENSDAGVSVQGNISFGVKFWLNSVTINTHGFVDVLLAQHGDELYELSKALPDLFLKNVVFGTRRMRWQNSVTVKCKKTNCEAELTFDTVGNDEVVRGKIKRDGEVVLTIDGSLDDEIFYSDDDDGDDNEHLLLALAETTEKPPVHIPPQTDPYPSLKVWEHVSRAIIENNMTEADKAKQVVEDEQRVRTRAGEDEKKERKYFIKDEGRGLWMYKDGSYKPENL